MRVLALTLSICMVCLANKEKPRPAFKDFPVKTIFKGEPVPANITADWRSYRTMIRRGAKSRVEFAGHYTVPRWGCGSSCNGFVVVDSISGRVYDGLSISGFSLRWENEHGEMERMEVHPNSRLLKINACINETDCGYYDYEMVDGKGLKLLRKELLPDEFQ